MTASPKVNGHRRSAMPVFGDWQPVPAVEQPAPAPQPEPEVEQPTQAAHVADPRAEAEAEAIRARTAAETEAARIRAEAEADAIRAKAAEEAEKQRLANERTAMRLERERAEQEAKTAEARRKKEEADRQRREAAEAAEAEKQAAQQQSKTVEKAASRWRRYALSFYIVCAIVALPVQMSAFWSPDAPWLLIAPLMLEGGAWVVLKGAAAAVAAHRPHWHYRLIAWALAFIAAGINLTHGLHAFDAATAIGTAFASLAGPGVWDLHEHGRIRARDGMPTRAERREKRRAEKAAAKQRRAEEKAAEEAAEELAAAREAEFPEEWQRALALAAAVGETTPTEAVWERAWDELHAAKPGETVDAVRVRNAAARRMLNARNEEPGSDASKVKSSQRPDQMPRPQRGPARRPPVRRAGDTPKYVSAAKKQAAITAKQAASEGGQR